MENTLLQRCKMCPPCSSDHSAGVSLSHPTHPTDFWITQPHCQLLFTFPAVNSISCQDGGIFHMTLKFFCL